MALSKQELKEVRKIASTIKNSGMNPWGNTKKIKFKSKKPIFNREDADDQGDMEKFKKNQ
jgi:hypothetical protein